MARKRFGTIQELEPGKRYRVKWTANGSRQDKYIRGTRSDAEDFLEMVRIGVEGAETTTTYSQYWNAVVWPSCQNLSPHTIAEYERLWRVELEPRIGKKRISSTTFRMAQNVISEIEAPSVQAKCKRLWHKICRMAMEQDRLIEYNPITRDIVTKKVVRREKRLVEADEVRNLMQKIRGIKYEPVILMALGCGLSPEEVLALTWEDVEFDDSFAYISINKTIIGVKGKRILQDHAKNDFRIRTCVLGEPFVSRLREISGSGPVCKGIEYRPGAQLSERSFASPTTVAHNWKRWCDMPGNGTDYTSLENMRSSFATLCGEACIPDSLVSMAMGHSDGTTKGKNYQKNTIRSMRLVASMLGEYIEETAPKDDKAVNMVNTATAGKILGLTSEQVMMLCKKGKLPAEKIGARWYVDKSKL